jgi:hypothetical protein
MLRYTDVNSLLTFLSGRQRLLDAMFSEESQFADIREAIIEASLDLECKENSGCGPRETNRIRRGRQECSGME